MTRVNPEPAGGEFESPSPTRVGFGVLALAWRRDDGGAIERLPIDVTPVPNLRE
jgi:hypothetical protein